MYPCKTMEGRINLRSQFFKGFYHGIPIALGYLSVSFGFGIMTMKAGISALAAVGISLSNLTSAGQVAGVGVIAAGGTIVEIILTQIIINLRYVQKNFYYITLFIAVFLGDGRHYHRSMW